MEYLFQRYLAAKRTVDDRALNRLVWQEMADFLGTQPSCAILEAGAGTGTMFQRMLEWGALMRGSYTTFDASLENAVSARQELAAWAKTQGLSCLSSESGRRMAFAGVGREIQLQLETADVFDFAQQAAGKQTWDLLVAHAFLDLFDIDKLLGLLIPLVKPGGRFYLTINFDGETIFEPVWDVALENQIIEAYHRSMDERIIAEEPSGDSRAGRHLFQALAEHHLEILCAGSSDWVVYPVRGVYPADEAYFLHHILHFFEESVGSRPELETGRFWDWIRRRHEQVEQGELIFMAHQLDFLVGKPF
jgi:SAM-dependent methyltransferase